MLTSLQKNNLGSLIQELNEDVKWSAVKDRYIYIIQDAIKIWEQENVFPVPEKFGIDCFDYSDVYKLELLPIWGYRPDRVARYQEIHTNIILLAPNIGYVSKCCLLSAAVIGKRKFITMQGDIMEHLKIGFSEFNGIQYGFDGVEEFHPDLNICKKWHNWIGNGKYRIGYLFGERVRGGI
jgi:hypothetical protein